MATKHSRSESESDDDSEVRFVKIVRADTDSASSLATFVDLPFELRTTILELASQRRPKSGEAVNGSEARERLRLDYGTLFSLILVSRELYTILSPLLWRNVKITRPSALVELRQALIADPSKASLVKSLHVGPIGQLPRGWWPARYKEPHEHDWLSDEPIELLKTSLGKRDGHLLPRWCKPGQEWAYTLPARTCQGAAVSAAINAALEAVKVGLSDPEYEGTMFADGQGDGLGINKWTKRVFYVQGVLDLYLIEMRRIEDAEERRVRSWTSTRVHPTPQDPSKCRSRKCGHYPRLRLEGFAGSNSKKDQSKEKTKEQTFKVTRERVKAHLLRRLSLTDSFEHPLLFARSRLRMLTLGPGSSIAIDHEEEDVDNWYPDEELGDDRHAWGEYYRYNDDDFSDPSLSQLGSPGSALSSTSDRSDTNDVFDLAHCDGIVALCRSVLQRLPKLENLSLTGYLHFSLGHKPPSFPTLRCLSLGPPTSPPAFGLSLEGMELPSLEKLRFCAGDMSSKAAQQVAGTKGEWKRLREMRWDYGKPLRQGSWAATSFYGDLKRLQGLQVVNDSPSPPPAGQSSSSKNVDAEKASQDGPIETATRYIEARFHPTLVSAILDKVPSGRIRKAWREGSLVKDARTRIRLIESATPEDEAEREGNRAVKLHSYHCKEAEQWWEECAWAIERGEQLTSK